MKQVAIMGWMSDGTILNSSSQFLNVSSFYNIRVDWDCGSPPNNEWRGLKKAPFWIAFDNVNTRSEPSSKPR